MVLWVSLSETNRRALRPQAAHSRPASLTTFYISKDRPAYAGRVGAAPHRSADLWKAGYFLFLGCRTGGNRLGGLNRSSMGILMMCTCYVYTGRLVARHLCMYESLRLQFHISNIATPGSPNAGKSNHMPEPDPFTL